MEQWFAGKVVLVTGGGDGIGRSAALIFAQRGARVVVVDIKPAAAAATAELIRAAGGEALGLGADVTDKSAVQGFVDEAVHRYGRLDCAFNNAGITHSKDSTWDDEAFDRTLAVNLYGIKYCMQLEVPEMLKAGGGAIVNTSSINGLIASGSVPLPAYTSSKHAVIGLTKTAALQYARQNIRVNALCPGVTRTAMVADVMNYSEQARQTLENFAPIGRMARPEEIAEAAIWLCSDKASFITGHALVVDGGYVAA